MAKSVSVLWYPVTVCMLWRLVRSQCDDKSLSECIRPMERYNLSTQSSLVPTFDALTMSNLCRTYDSVRPCLLAQIPDCRDLQRAALIGADQGNVYICDETFQEYVLHQPCLSQSALEPEIERDCHDVFKTRVDSIPRGGNPTERNTLLCRYITLFISCLHSVAGSYCGPAAADWLRTFDTRNIGPVFGYIDCPILEPYYPTWQEYDKSVKSTTTSSLTPTNTTPVSQWDNIVLIGSVTGAIVVIAIVIAVATVCIYRSRHPPPVIKAEQPPPYTRYSVSNGATIHTEGNTPEEKSPDITAHPGPPAIPSAPPEEH